MMKRNFLTQSAYTLEPGLLMLDTVYYWRVTAASKDKEKKRENRGGAKQFRMSPVPAAPTLKSFIPEADGATIIRLTKISRTIVFYLR